MRFGIYNTFSTINILIRIVHILTSLNTLPIYKLNLLYCLPLYFALSFPLPPPYILTHPPSPTKIHRCVTTLTPMTSHHSLHDLVLHSVYILSRPMGLHALLTSIRTYSVQLGRTWPQPPNDTFTAGCTPRPFQSGLEFF